MSRENNDFSLVKMDVKFCPQQISSRNFTEMKDLQSFRIEDKIQTLGKYYKNWLWIVYFFISREVNVCNQFFFCVLLLLLVLRLLLLQSSAGISVVVAVAATIATVTLAMPPLQINNTEKNSTKKGAISDYVYRLAYLWCRFYSMPLA